MVINFRTRMISQDTYKLARISTSIKKIRTFSQSKVSQQFIVIASLFFSFYILFNHFIFTNLSVKVSVALESALSLDLSFPLCSYFLHKYTKNSVLTFVFCSRNKKESPLLLFLIKRMIVEGLRKILRFLF